MKGLIDKVNGYKYGVRNNRFELQIQKKEPEFEAPFYIMRKNVALFEYDEFRSSIQLMLVAGATHSIATVVYQAFFSKAFPLKSIGSYSFGNHIIYGRFRPLLGQPQVIGIITPTIRMGIHLDF